MKVTNEKDFSPEALPTEVAAKTIKHIDKGTVHRICSGQVVLTLATAVKELVENSLDAGATSVEIRIRDHGSSLIEVSDNGKGVEPHNFSGLTLKHHTSKLQDFGDLIGVKTYGFRGEALSSLCALSNLSIITRHSDQTVGTKLIYDSNGLVIEQISIPRQIGTTVVLENLFCTLPVRHKEFHRNLKKEFNKMVLVLYSYCIISKNVRINCTNMTNTGKKTVIVSTNGHVSIKDNISSIFGPKQVSTLLEIKKKTASDEHLTEFGISKSFHSKDDDEAFQFEGYISSCAHGLGRSASDRQFFYINSRPCDPTKINRLINEVHHYFNRHQFPFVVLNIVMNSADIDVNVTPDKRQIFVNQEKLLLAALKTTLMGLYENIPSTYDLQNQSLMTSTLTPKSNSLKIFSNSSPTHRLSMLSAKFSRSPSSCDVSSNTKRSQIQLENDFESPLPKQRRLDVFLKKDPPCTNERDNFSSKTLQPFLPSSISEPENKSAKDLEEDLINLNSEDSFASLSTQNSYSHINDSNNVKKFENLCQSETSLPAIKSVPSPLQHSPMQTSETDAFLSRLKLRKSLTTKNSPVSAGNEKNHTDIEVLEVKEEKIPSIQSDFDSFPNSPDISTSTHTSQTTLHEPDIIHEKYDDTDPIIGRRKSFAVDFSLISLREKLLNKKKERGSSKEVVRRFRAAISPSDNQSAEGELKKEISKDMFAKMKVLGQFNLGFIIAMLGSDLFIIDQHATDEKYNFETLAKTCVLQNQRLISPQQLELTPVNESILLDNIDIFNKNGFEFVVDDNHLAGRRVSLVSMPHSRGWEFKREDVEELIFMLSDAPGVMCRPSRIRAMFASRACRKSVMIGTALSFTQMRTLVDHMGQIEQPWNCPHGRPTMRHLLNIDIISKL